MCANGQHYYRATYDRYGNRTWTCEHCHDEKDG
jgi:hypothetical protein